MKTYEGMFLLDAGGPSFEEAVAPIHAVFERNGVDVLAVKKWDDRRLAYEIKGRRRGLYVLTYFKADPESIGAIERDVQLNEGILRVLILACGDVTEETLAKATPAEAGRRDRERAAAGADAEQADAAAPEADASAPEADASAPEADASAPEAQELAPAAESPVTAAEAPADTAAEKPGQ